MNGHWKSRKEDDSVSPVIATILLVAITVVLAAVLYATISSMGINTTTAPPVVGTSRSTTATDWVFTVTAISGGRTILQSDVYVQLKNSTGFVITTEPLLNASGTHGFKYVPGNSDAFLEVGDVFLLSKDYTVGTIIMFVNPTATGQYALITV